MLRLRLNLSFIVGCFLVVACGGVAFATTAIIPRDDEMVVESRAIVTGRVTDVSTAVDTNTDLVYTYIRLHVNEVLKGQIIDSEIVLKELGGETQDRGTMIFGMPRFQAGEEVLVYLNTWPDGALRVHQGFLGKFNITRDATTGQMFVERQSEGENVAILKASAGTNRSAVGAYTRMVKDLVEANHKRILSFERRYYSNIPVLAQPVEFAAKVVRNEMTPLWAYLNPTSPSRWFEPDNNQSVVFYVNPIGAPSMMQIPEDVQGAMTAWSTAGGSIRVTYGGQTGGCGTQTADGYNTISFNNCDNYFPVSQSCSGLLAVSGIIRYTPSQTKVIGTTRFAKAVEANMSFNPYALCNFTSRCQIQEVLTHEMGHALGLGHSSDSSATMSPYIHFDNRCASIKTDDVQGITTIYPGASSGIRLSIMTSDLPAAKPDLDYTANLEATGGTGAYQWSIVSGQMPWGMQLGMNGMLFGKTGNSGDFPFVAQVRDSAGNTSQGSFILVVKQPGLPPIVASAEYRNKKVFLTGTNFEDGAVVYVDGEQLSAALLDVTTLRTQKRKQKPGVHQGVVMNPDGKQSAMFQFVVE